MKDINFGRIKIRISPSYSEPKARKSVLLLVLLVSYALIFVGTVYGEPKVGDTFTVSGSIWNVPTGDPYDKNSVFLKSENGVVTGEIHLADSGVYKEGAVSSDFVGLVFWWKKDMTFRGVFNNKTDPPRIEGKCNLIDIKKNYYNRITRNITDSTERIEQRCTAVIQDSKLVGCWMGNCISLPITYPEKTITLKLKHYPPFPYLEKSVAQFSKNENKGGDVVATLLDKDEFPMVRSKVYFYVEKGSGLDGPLRSPSKPPAEWSDIYPNLENAHEYSYLGSGITNNKGEVTINYIDLDCIDQQRFSEKLIDEGTVSGNIVAVLFNKRLKKVVYQRTIPVEFRYIGKIVDIKKEGHQKISGNVRIKRSMTTPGFDFMAVNKGFNLMPGDIINVDGGTEIRILLIDASIVDIRVPKTIPFEDGLIYIPYKSIVLLSTGHNTGFNIGLEKATTQTFGFSTSKGVDFLTGRIPGIGKKSKISIDIRDSEREVDLSTVDILTKIQINGKTIVDQVDDGINVYNFDGSSSVNIAGGKSIILPKNKMAAISKEGTLVRSSSFNPGEVESEFLNIHSVLPKGFKGVYIGSRSNSQKNKVLIPVKISGVNKYMGPMEFIVKYDPKVLTADGLILGSKTDNTPIHFDVLDGYIKVDIPNLRGFRGDGSLAYLKFNVTGRRGSYSILYIEDPKFMARDHSIIDVDIGEGIFKVIGSRTNIGDYDGDGILTSIDALAALQMAVGRREIDLRMDVNRDGQVNSFDASEILTRIVEAD